MSVSSLREITLGVSNLAVRTQQFERGCGLQTLSSGPLTSITAGRLFDLHVTPRASLMGRPDLADSAQLRLVEVPGGGPTRTLDPRSPGPLGIGFTAFGLSTVQSRLQSLAVDFSTPPLGRGSTAAESLGRTEDGDFIVLSEGTDDPGSSRGPVDCGEPRDALFVVTNLDACLHFMRDALEQEAVAAEAGALRLATIHRPGSSGGRVVFHEFDRRLEPMGQTPALSRGLCRLRYDTDDLHSTLARVPGGGGALVRGPASIDDPVLGRALVAMVRAPFGVLIELWQTN